jgi:hypothetical protein
MRNPSLTETVRHIPPEQLQTTFEGLGPAIAVTTGVFEYPATCETRDLDWNHMDQHHRPCVHQTYRGAARLALGYQFALSLTRSGPFGSFVQVTDVRLGPGLFYQGFSLFGLVYVHCVLENPRAAKVNVIRVTWYIVSHRLLKFTHRVIDRRLRQLNEVQNREDGPIRLRRAELRARGFFFASDAPDFVSSNQLTRNVRPPTLRGEVRFPIPSVNGAAPVRLTRGPVELLVRRDTAGIVVWPGTCPHEGGPLDEGTIHGDVIECPWHGLRFPAAALTSPAPRRLIGDWEVFLDGTDLVVQERVER